MVLTDKTVKELICPSGKKDVLVQDADLPGFAVRVQANGKRTFLFNYRFGSVVRRLPIGVFGTEITTAKARRQAEMLRGILREGRDPWSERKAAMAQAEVAEAEAALTVSVLIDDFDRRHLAAKRPSYRRDFLSRTRQHLASIKDSPAAHVTRKDAVRVVDAARDNAGTTTARRVLQYARTMFGWARERALIEANPFEAVPAPGAVMFRDRVLTGDEIGAVWRAAEGLQHPYGPLTRFLLLTLARRDEVAGMRRSEVAADLSAWTLPPERAKNNKAHVVHLSEPARALLLAALGAGAAPDALVFGTLNRTKVSSFAWIKGKLDKAIATERGKDSPPLPGWTFHDFRRSGVTWLADVGGFPPHVADKLLNHVQGTVRGVAAVYQRGEFLTERQRALDAWAAHVLACAEAMPAADNVVPMRRA